jgi:multidrug resistance efflux pump
MMTTLSACGAGESESPATQPGGARQAVPVELASVRLEPLDRTIDIPGQLHGDELATISAKVPGRIRAIRADVGDRVHPGAELARIDPTDYELVVTQRELALGETLAKLGVDELPAGDFDIKTVATVQRAGHEADNARAKLDRARQLHEQDPPLISDQEFADISTAQDVAASDYSVAMLEARSLLALARSRSSELDAARQRLLDTHVRAPGSTSAVLATTGASTTSPAISAPAETSLPRFAVTARLTSEGEYVREGDPLFRVVADDPIKFRAGVSEQFVPQVRTGQRVILRVEGYDRDFQGRVNRINP